MEDSTTQEMTIVEAIKAHDDRTTNNCIHTKFKVQMGNEKCEDTIAHNKLMDHLNNLDEGSTHCKNHPSHVGSPHDVKVEWENGKITEEPLNIIAADAPVACAICSKKKNLLNQKWFYKKASS